MRSILEHYSGKWCAPQAGAFMLHGLDAAGCAHTWDSSSVRKGFKVGGLEVVQACVLGSRAWRVESVETVDC